MHYKHFSSDPWQPEGVGKYLVEVRMQHIVYRQVIVIPRHLAILCLMCMSKG